MPHRSRGCLPARPHGHVVPPWSSSWPWVPPHSSPWVPLKPWVSFRSLSWPCSARPVVVVEWVPVARPCRCGNLPLVLETVGAPSLIVMAVWCPPLILMGVGASSLDLVVVAVAVVPHSPLWLLVPPPCWSSCCPAWPLVLPSHCGSRIMAMWCPPACRRGPVVLLARPRGRGCLLARPCGRVVHPWSSSCGTHPVHRCGMWCPARPGGGWCPPAHPRVGPFGHWCPPVPFVVHPGRPGCVVRG